MFHQPSMNLIDIKITIFFLLVVVAHIVETYMIGSQRYQNEFYRIERDRHGSENSCVQCW